MAGIFAITGAKDYDDRCTKAEALARSMCLMPWQTATVMPLAESRIILGSVGNGSAIVPDERFVARQGAVTCVVEGDLIRSLEDCGIETLVAAGRYAEAAIAAYRKFGEEFPRRLEGAFTVLLHDADTETLVAANGRFASTILYRRVVGDDVFYCSQLGPMVGCGVFRPRINEEAVGHLLGNMQVFNDETVIEEVDAFKPATIAVHRLREGAEQHQIYWTFGAVGEHRHDLPYERHVGDICDVIVAAGQRMTSRPGRYVAGLSGGLDSRLVAAVAARNVPDLKVWTFGAAGALDMVVAAEVARRLGIDHLTFPTVPEHVPENADLYSATVDGSASIDFAYGVERTRVLREHADIVLNGFAGDVLLGGSLLGPKPNIFKKNLRSRRFLGRGVVQPFLEWNRDEESVLGYLHAKSAPPTHLAGCLRTPPQSRRERIAADLQAMAATVPLPFRVEHHFMTNRVSRWTLMGIISDRHYYSDGSIFYDYEFLDRCMAIPHAYRRENRIYADVFRRLLPDMGAVVNANNGLPADAPPWRSLMSKITRGVGRRLRRQPLSTQVTGSDPNVWSRSIYPRFYRELLRDERTASRGVWDIAAVRSLFDRHLAGEVNAGNELGQLASFELFCRRWVD
jgi:asparagine synthase (glutamine-hydrolysing)